MIFYWALLGALTQLQWNMASWDVEGPGGRVATDALNSITTWAAQYRCVHVCMCMCECRGGVQAVFRGAGHSFTE